MLWPAIDTPLVAVALGARSRVRLAEEAAPLTSTAVGSLDVVLSLISVTRIVPSAARVAHARTEGSFETALTRR